MSVDACGQDQDQALDLAPAAEMVDIADLAAPAGAGRGLARRVGAEAGDQFGRVGGGRAVGQVDVELQLLPRAFFFVEAPL